MSRRISETRQSPKAVSSERQRCVQAVGCSRQPIPRGTDVWRLPIVKNLTGKSVATNLREQCGQRSARESRQR